MYNNKKLNCEKQNLTSNYVNLKTINSGGKSFLYFNKQDKELLVIPEYMQVCFSGNYSDVKSIIKSLNLKEVFFEVFEDYYIFYGYTSGWLKYKILNNKKVNFQIVFFKGVITVGYPMIYGSY